MLAIDRADARFQDEFVAFDARPSAERNLAAALQQREQRTFGHDGGARFGMVELVEHFGRFGVVGTAFHADGALTDRRACRFPGERISLMR